jgi:hypothetical protein
MAKLMAHGERAARHQPAGKRNLEMSPFIGLKELNCWPNPSFADHPVWMPDDPVLRRCSLRDQPELHRTMSWNIVYLVRHSE